MLDFIKENVQNKVPCKTNKAKKKKVHLLSKKTIFTRWIMQLKPQPA